MNQIRMVCKHCGGKTFHADVSASGWVDSTGVWLDDDNKPHFESDGHVQDTWDYDVERYVCTTCSKGSYRLAELVVAPPREDGQPIAPCGRCDHGRAEHAEAATYYKPREDYTRGSMPCEHEGCDCHDYYDVAIANAGQDPELLAAIGKAA